MFAVTMVTGEDRKKEKERTPLDIMEEKKEKGLRITQRESPLRKKKDQRKNRFYRGIGEGKEKKTALTESPVREERRAAVRGCLKGGKRRTTGSPAKHPSAGRKKRGEGRKASGCGRAAGGGGDQLRLDVRGKNKTGWHISTSDRSSKKERRVLPVSKTRPLGLCNPPGKKKKRKGKK